VIDEMVGFLIFSLRPTAVHGHCSNANNNSRGHEATIGLYPREPLTYRFMLALVNRHVEGRELFTVMIGSLSGRTRFDTFTSLRMSPHLLCQG
jgi:hypothetical protein